MKDTTLIINTLGRVNKQITWNNLTPLLRQHTVLSVQDHEKELYPDYPVWVLPRTIENLPQTRQYLLEKCPTRYMIIMDDDLSFFTRRNGDHKHLHKITPEELEVMFDDMLHAMETGYPMVGISAREGNNRQPASFAECTRSMRIFGLDLDIVREIGARFDRTKTKEDMDMTLQILRAGYKNLVYYGYANDHVSSNAPGGCAIYRTLQLMEQDAHVLANLHPGFVRVVKKQTKTSWNGQERTDVIVQWKKAYASGQRVEEM